jgi:hypothetical protein
MNANDIANRLGKKGASVDIQEGNQVYAYFEEEVRISDIYVLLEGKVPFNNIEKIGARTFRITATETEDN